MRAPDDRQQQLGMVTGETRRADVSDWLRRLEVTIAPDVRAHIPGPGGTPPPPHNIEAFLTTTAPALKPPEPEPEVSPPSESIFRTALRHPERRRRRDPAQDILDRLRRIRTILAVCDVVIEGHAQGRSHGGLNPAAIRLDALGQPTVTAWRGGPGPAEARSQAPEASRGEFTPRGDVYSLGAMLYHALTGRAPANGRRPRLRTGDRRLEAVCAKALAVRPEDRYTSVRAFREDLERAVAGLPVRAASADSSLEHAASWIAAHRFLWLIPILMMAGLAAALVFALHAERSANQRLRAQNSQWIRTIVKLNADTDRLERRNQELVEARRDLSAALADSEASRRAAETALADSEVVRRDHEARAANALATLRLALTTTAAPPLRAALEPLAPRNERAAVADVLAAIGAFALQRGALDLAISANLQARGLFLTLLDDQPDSAHLAQGLAATQAGLLDAATDQARAGRHAAAWNTCRAAIIGDDHAPGAAERRRRALVIATNAALDLGCTDDALASIRDRLAQAQGNLDAVRDLARCAALPAPDDVTEARARELLAVLRDRAPSPEVLRAEPAFQPFTHRDDFQKLISALHDRDFPANPFAQP